MPIIGKNMISWYHLEILERPNAKIAVNRNSASKLAKALKKLELINVNTFETVV